jgi:aminopeptidase N
LSNKWLQQAGLNQLEAVMEEDNEGKLKKFDLKQIPSLPQHPNLQSHMIDILFVYENENKVFKKILVNPEEITSVSEMIGEVAPKAVVLNYNDWAYLKWIVDQKSFNYLKDNLLERIPDILTRQLFYRSILELTRDAKISGPEYLDIIIKMIRHETNEDIISNSIKNIAPLIANYIPIRVYPHYASQMFDLTCELLGKNISNKEIVLNLIEALLSFAYLPEHAEFLKNWLIDGPSVTLNGNKVTIPSNLLTQDHRFSIVAFIHKIRTISIEEKSKLLEAEVERDKNSDRSIRARCSCKASLPDPAVKAEIWDKLINNPTSESLYNMKSYMAHFAPINQLDIVDDYLRIKFFDDVLKIGNQDFFYITPFMMYFSPVLLVENEIIEKLETLAEKAKEFENLQKKLLELIDDMKRFRKAQSLAEIYLSILNKWGP